MKPDSKIKRIIKSNDFIFRFSILLVLYLTMALVTYYGIYDRIPELYRELSGNIFVLFIVVFSCYVRLNPTTTASILVDLSTVIMAVLLSVHWFDLHNGNFVVVINELLTLILIPVMIYTTLKERLDRRLKYLSYDSISSSELNKLSPIDIESKIKDSTSFILKKYILLINKALESKEFYKTSCVIYIEKKDIPFLINKQEVLREFYKKYGYQFKISLKYNEIIVDWSYIP